MALIPHYRCEKWLAHALTSLCLQSRRVDRIVVIDDASPRPPTRLVEKFPAVTLLRASQNVGPYALVQAVIDQTDADAYLFQDADDWSRHDRVARLLTEAERTHAELIGSYAVQVFDSCKGMTFRRFPTDANAALHDDPGGFPLFHPTSIVSRDLVMRIGGFATGLRFGGDAEFMRRAHYAARLVNVPDYCYFRRYRVDSLTNSHATGFGTPARVEVTEWARQKSCENSARVARGKPPDLSPLATVPPVQLIHVTGPAVKTG